MKQSLTSESQPKTCSRSLSSLRSTVSSSDTPTCNSTSHASHTGTRSTHNELVRANRSVVEVTQIDAFRRCSLANGAHVTRFHFQRVKERLRLDSVSSLAKSCQK